MARFCILGWGKTGKAVAQYLRDHVQGAPEENGQKGGFHGRDSQGASGYDAVGNPEKNFRKDQDDLSGSDTAQKNTIPEPTPKDKEIPSRIPSLGHGDGPLDHKGRKMFHGEDPLHGQSTKNKVWVWDDDPQIRKGAKEAGFTLWTEDLDWTKVTLVVSPGIGEHPLRHRAASRGCEILSDIQLFRYFFPQVPCIGVTGSNGKTTTCSLLEHGLKKHGIPCILSGNIGIPIFSTLRNGIPPEGVYIIELSSYQLELCSQLNLEVALVLNLTPHHLERHESMEAYRAIKERIFMGARKGWIPDQWPKVALPCPLKKASTDPQGTFPPALRPNHEAPRSDDLASWRYGEDLPTPPMAFTRTSSPPPPSLQKDSSTLPHEGAPTQGKILSQKVPPSLEDLPVERIPYPPSLEVSQGKAYPSETSQRLPQTIHSWSEAMARNYVLPDFLKTQHNRENVAAAAAVLQSLGCHKTHIFEDFKGIPHRQEVVACHKGVTYCNDSKATNPQALALALQAHGSNPIFWIGGGVLQRDDLSPLDPWACGIVQGFVIGEAAQRYAQWLHHHNIPVTLCTSLEEAVQRAQKEALEFLETVKRSSQGKVWKNQEVKGESKDLKKEGSPTNMSEEFLSNIGISPPFSLESSLDMLDKESPFKKSSEAPSPLKEGRVTLLFSPGCASFDQFRDFEHRGDVFVRAVRESMESLSKS